MFIFYNLLEDNIPIDFTHRVSFRLHSQKRNGFVDVRAFNMDISRIVHQIAEPDYSAAVSYTHLPDMK